ncbi:MAG: DUF4388 domain-containing protein [Verrucomicrobiae bacterium]|nr:DUF4388 domain-containing protein [Verrucomicrobiae bacterium]
MFSGNFTQIAFGEVLRLLHAASQTGELRISDDHAMSASVYLKGGHIVHVEADTETGLDALSVICQHVNAAFSFEVGTLSAQENLAGVPTKKVIESVTTRVTEINTLRQFAPGPHDLILYKPGKSLDHLDTTPEDLSLLLTADGKRSAEKIAHLNGKSFDQIVQALAKFNQAGIIDIQKNATPPLPDEPMPTPEVADPSAPLPDSPQTTAVRYWRGKKIE